MISLESPAKINLSLKVLKKRTDGYHDLEMTLSPISIYDTICLSYNNENKVIVTSEPFGPADKDNLAHAATKYYFNKAGFSQGVSINIKKIIPMGSGLGGGSSNAATVIMGLEKLFENPIKPYAYDEIACELGADVPFFLEAKTSFIQGIGEKITPTPLKYPLYLIVISPDFGFSTRNIFLNFDKYSNTLELTEKNPNDNYSGLKFEKLSAFKYDRHFFKNDLQDVANLIDKRIEMYLNLLLSNGASRVLMSGSGSSVYGIFENQKKQGDAFGSIRNEIASNTNKSLVNKNNASIKLFLAQTIA